jgi:predicted nucleic acid-binding protein
LKNNASEISTYLFNPEDELLLDTNIWLRLYGPAAKSGDPRTTVYSKALGEMLAANCQIYIDVLILSEYINRYVRLRHNLLKARPGINPNFKQFRRSVEFKAIASDVAGDVRQILKHCDRLESNFAALDITGLVKEFEKGDSDFNDQVLAELCKSRNLTLVTHDGDFKDLGLNLLTANQNLLS